MQPVFFVRKRSDGIIKMLDKIIETLEKTNFVPNPIKILVKGGKFEPPEGRRESTIDEQLAAVNGESPLILLSKEANREQLEIAERIEQHDAVLVQGPPGTGKTHTIANLLGHFLAQGKTVLVTSQTKKALSILKEKVPDAIKDLCVAVLDETNQDMVRSIDGITDVMSRFTADDKKGEMESRSQAREEIIARLAEIRKKIYQIKYKEFEPLAYNGKSYSLIDAAQFVNANASKLSALIPGKVKLGHSLPATIEQLNQLYQSNGELSLLEEIELNYDLPASAEILSPEEFAADLNKSAECNETIKRIANELKLQFQIDLNQKAIGVREGNKIIPLVKDPSAEALTELAAYLSDFKNFEEWMIYAAADGKKGGGYRQKWDKLIKTVKDTADLANNTVSLLAGKNIEIKSEIFSSQLQADLEKAAEKFRTKGKITGFDLLFNKQLKSLMKGISINGKPISSEEDCYLVQQFIELKERRENTAGLWDELMAKHGAPNFDELDENPEYTACNEIPKIRNVLEWHSKLLELVKKAGFNVSFIFPQPQLDKELNYIKEILNITQTKLPSYLELAESLLNLSKIEKDKELTIANLSKDRRSQSSFCQSLVAALKNNDYESYEQNYQQLATAYSKRALKERREEILALIEPLAADWAKAIRKREGIHSAATCPAEIEDAWKWKQFAAIIDAITSEPFEELNRQAVNLENDLRQVTAEVAANSAWYHLLSRTEQDLDMRQALQGWKQTIKKIGKGTGKNAPLLRRRARALMAKCQEAVPAWIMTIDKAAETLDPAKNTFDVIIVDEASQADISALSIVYMAKKIIIVGDDKQVSPMAVGIDSDKVNALLDMHLKDRIPNWHLYDAKTSIYDIAATTFQPLMLREHFRCMPDIIGYSNKLCYDFKIKPLRAEGTAKVRPAIITYRVDGGKREGKNKKNPKEAETIVALMSACIEQKEYNGLTFGVISLLGNETDQVQEIQQLILQKLEPSVIEERRILCGNPSHFQGDERDVIFLSLVDSNEGDGPLTLVTEGLDKSRMQRYNVAVSRAKDQLWIVHSLDYTRDLKSNDLRRDLLEYATNPKAFAERIKESEAKSESPFEKEVGKSLLAFGYNIEQQWPVGAYRIDIAVRFQGKTVAVECDGNQYHRSEEQIRADMERQAVLERTGLRFIRIRGSEYYRDPQMTMEKVKKELEEYGIFPESSAEEALEQSKSDLIDRIKIRAAQILDEWQAKDDNVLDASLKRKTKQSAREIMLIHTLEVSGISFIDNRAQSGIIWILSDGVDPTRVEKIIKQSGLKYSFEKRGAKATDYQPAWRVMAD